MKYRGLLETGRLFFIFFPIISFPFLYMSNAFCDSKHLRLDFHDSGERVLMHHCLIGLPDQSRASYRHEILEI